MPAFFVTATGTDIGKTHVACALLAAARPGATAFKPVASGFDSAHLAGTDPGRLLVALGRPPTLDAIAAICPWRLEAPLSPDFAAEREGVELRFDDVRAWCETALAAAQADASTSPESALTLVEGAGGVLSPIAADALGLDLMEALAIPAILVAGAYVGTLSHTLTALGALRARGVEVAAVVVNAWPRPETLRDTLKLLERHSRDPAPVLTLDAAAAHFAARAP